VERTKPLTIAGLLIGAAALIVIVIVVVRVFLLHAAYSPSPATANETTTEFDDEAALKAAERIDAAMIGYHEVGSFSVGLREPRALAVDSHAQIYVGGDRIVAGYSSDGKNLAEYALQGEPRCLAIGALDTAKPASLYVGMQEHVEVFDSRGTRTAVWGSRGAEAFFTSITTTEREVWVADAGNRLVWRFDATGKLLQPVGKPDASQNRPEFFVTSHYFDVAAGIDDLVYVVNPRLMRVESYTRNGDYEAAWGKGSPAVADFFGCCNPAHLAILPDGRFVTGEKGIPRVKIYSRDGRFETVVAGPSQLTDTPADLATDRLGRVLVLDGRAAKVRVFEKNSADRGTKQ